jgi:hypothetical protein
MMRRSLLLGFVSTFAVASAALAATGGKAPRSTLGQAVYRTSHATSLRYSMVIAVTRKHYPSIQLRIHGTRTTGSLFVHVKAFSTVLADGTALPGPQQSALIDGPFLYEGSPNGVAVQGKIRWLRIPIARIGTSAPAIAAMHNLSPAPLLRVVDEWSRVRTRSPHGVFRGKVAYDDPVVLAALSGMTGGIQFRDVAFAARIGDDGFVHSITVTGKTADRSRVLRATVKMFGFGRPVRVSIPGEGTFMDQKLLSLAE